MEKLGCHAILKISLKSKTCICANWHYHAKVYLYGVNNYTLIDAVETTENIPVLETMVYMINWQTDNVTTLPFLS